MCDTINFLEEMLTSISPWSDGSACLGLWQHSTLYRGVRRCQLRSLVCCIVMGGEGRQTDRDRQRSRDSVYWGENEHPEFPYCL